MGTIYPIDVPIWLVVALTVLATARVTRLVTSDKLTAPLRKRLIDRLGDESWVTYLAHCDWCTSMWVSAPAAVVVTLYPNRWVLMVLMWLAISQMVGLLSRLDRG